MAPNYALEYPYRSRRSVVFASRGMVIASQPLASQVGLRTLLAGGNAVDAAVATAAALTALEPTANGVGGDVFAIAWIRGKLYGLNASGPSPRRASLEHLSGLGFTAMPKHGAHSVTVPGAPSAWVALSKRFGRLSLTDTLEPAVTLAREGFPVSPTVAFEWNRAFQTARLAWTQPHFETWFKTFCPEGRAPMPGEVWRSVELAETLHGIAADDAKGFYRGTLADKVVECVRQAGGVLHADDLADFQPEWVPPIGIDYRGHRIWEMPPNGQGIVALMALNILKGFSFRERDSLATYHHQIEAIKLAFADGASCVADPRHMRVSVSDLLSDAHAARCRGLIREDQARLPLPGTPLAGGTVYLATADAEGNMVSFIQSNNSGFGSGLVVPGTAIALQNRGHNFSFEPGHPNQFGPAKRPYSTVMPGFITNERGPVACFGVIGGFMQPQGHVQMVMNAIDFGLNPQAALDAPRWEWTKDNDVSIEHATSEALFRGLASRGHAVSWSGNPVAFGRGQMIWRAEDGTLCGGTEPRGDGSIAAW